MALLKKELEISLKPDEWKKWTTLTNKAICKCYKDPSAVFRLGLETAASAHK
jgi:hypothetical protein